MKRRNWFILIVAYCSILIGGWTSTKLDVDFSLTTLSARSSQDYQNFQTYSKRFPADENGLVVSIGSDQKFDSQDGFFALEKVRLALENLYGVKKALAITSVELPQKSLLGTISKSLLPVEDGKRFTKRLADLSNYPDVTPKFLSDDRRATRLFLEVDWSRISFDKIKKIVGEFAFREVHFMGKEVFSSELKESLRTEVIFLPIIAGAILLLLFFAWFRDVRSLVLVASVLAINLSILAIVFYFSDIKIGILTSTTPLLVLVLSFSDLVHILYKYKRSDGGTTHERIHQTMVPLRLPLWLTSLTTAVAFGLFFISGIDEIMEFAFCTCIGIIAAFFTARFLVPIFIEVFAIRPFVKKAAFSSMADRLVTILRLRIVTMVVSMLFLVFVSVCAYTYFAINSSFHQSFGEDTAIGKSLRFADQYFEGVRTIEVILNSKNGLDFQTMSKVDAIEKELLEEYDCRSVFSVNTAIKRLNRFNHFGRTSQFVLPKTLNSTFLADLVKNKNELGLINAMTDDQKLFRIVGRLPDIGSSIAADKNKQLGLKLNELEDENHQLFMSGFSFVKDQSTTRITQLILVGIVLSLIVATIIIGLVFRSVKIALISFLPNFLPVIAGLSMLFLFGIELNPTTAMALSIIVGLALDDTIYFLSAMKGFLESNTADSVEQSLRENTFPAAVTSLILIIGFGVLMLSTIESNRNSGLLVATMLLIALISDLVILPALLRAFWTKKT